MVKSLVPLGIKNIKDYYSCFSDIVVECNTYGGKTFAQNSYVMGKLQRNARLYFVIYLRVSRMISDIFYETNAFFSICSSSFTQFYCSSKTNFTKIRISKTLG